MAFARLGLEIRRLKVVYGEMSSSLVEEPTRSRFNLVLSLSR